MFLSVVLPGDPPQISQPKNVGGGLLLSSGSFVRGTALSRVTFSFEARGIPSPSFVVTPFRPLEAPLRESSFWPDTYVVCLLFPGLTQRGRLNTCGSVRPFFLAVPVLRLNFASPSRGGLNDKEKSWKSRPPPLIHLPVPFLRHEWEDAVPRSPISN